MHDERQHDTLLSPFFGGDEALIFDFFNHGEIHAVQPDEPDSVRGPGGRRKQKRAAEACDAKYMQRRMKAPRRPSRGRTPCACKLD